MSFGGFGVSVGDLVAVGTFAWNIYKACKGASAEFEEVSHEVVTLHTAIKELEDEATNADSILIRAGSGKKEELDEIIKNCRTVLVQLERLLARYQSLGTKSKRTWDRIKFGTEGLQIIREKLTFHTSSINLFLTTLSTGSLGRIETKLEEIVEEIRAGKREPTVLTTVDNDNEEAETHWNALKSERIDDGFTRQDIEAHKGAIKAYIQELIDRGELQEIRRASASVGDARVENASIHINEDQALANERIADWNLSQELQQRNTILTAGTPLYQSAASHREDPNHPITLRQRNEVFNKRGQDFSQSDISLSLLPHSQEISCPNSRPASGQRLGHTVREGKVENATVMPDLPSRDPETQLKPLTMPNLPTWPSMYANDPGRPLAYPLKSSDVMPTNLPTVPPIIPRRTLTDDDRRRMCQYHLDNPTAKQTEIGAIFGVERSTVSKILRHIDKYLPPETPNLAPTTKRRFPDIDQALSNWVRNSQKQGFPLTDSAIKEKARFLAETTGSSDSYIKVNSTTWLRKFKQKNGIGIGELAPRASDINISDSRSINPDSAGSLASPTPNTMSPIIPTSPLPTEKSEQNVECGQGFDDFTQNYWNINSDGRPNSPSCAHPPAPGRKASGFFEEYQEDISEYDEFGRLRKRTVVRRNSSPMTNPMHSHNTSPIPSPPSWGHASPVSGYGAYSGVSLPSQSSFLPSPHKPSQYFKTDSTFPTSNISDNFSSILAGNNTAPISNHERNEKCPIATCDYHIKGFPRKFNRIQHILTHYKGHMVCGFCLGSVSMAEKSFSRADVFKRHLKSAHAVQQISPNSHMMTSGRINAGKKLADYMTAKCSTCSVIFNNVQNFYEHLDDCVLRIVEKDEVARRMSRVKELEAENYKFSNEIQNLTRKLATWEGLSQSAENGELMRQVVGLTSYTENLRISKSFYREERNYFRDIVSGIPEKADLVRQRPTSPVANNAWPHLESPKPASPLVKLHAMLREMEAMEIEGLESEWREVP